jgi:hypothetical protein
MTLRLSPSGLIAWDEPFLGGIAEGSPYEGPWDCSGVCANPLANSKSGRHGP